MPNPTFAIPSDPDDLHYIGDRECKTGWCGTHFPKPCEQEGCTGLVHANFGDENADGDYWLSTACDVCGEREAL